MMDGRTDGRMDGSAGGGFSVPLPGQKRGLDSCLVSERPSNFASPPPECLFLTPVGGASPPVSQAEQKKAKNNRVGRRSFFLYFTNEILLSSSV